jgi:ABC-2 type transport system ATP-binding protein
MIELTSLSKRFGAKVAVDRLTCTIQPGKVTGFLGPNGAGKSTTMRMIVGLDRPTHGWAKVNGKTFTASPTPITEVGALLDAKAAHPGRTGYAHLMALAATHRLGRKRVDQVVELTGLGPAARRRVKGYSLGMAQRLGIAAALLGNPSVVILDEPVNGLDPEGVAWVRHLVRSLADQGRTVFLSSHLMSEVAQCADHLVIIGKGRLIADASVEEIVGRASGQATRVRSPHAGVIAAALASTDVTVQSQQGDVVVLGGITPDQFGPLAAQQGWVVLELTAVTTSLEQAYMGLTENAVEYRSTEPLGAQS